jgi:hypothetical protein
VTRQLADVDAVSGEEHAAAMHLQEIQQEQKQAQIAAANSQM